MKVTQEQFEKEVDEEAKRLVKWFNKTDSPSDACAEFIEFILIELGESHFTTLGILNEVSMSYRNNSLESLKEIDEKNK